MAIETCFTPPPEGFSEYVYGGLGTPPERLLNAP